MNYNGQYNMPEQTPSWSPVGQQPSPIEYYPPVDQTYMNQGYSGYYNGFDPNLPPETYAPPPPLPPQEMVSPIPVSFSPVKAELRATAKEFVPNSGKSTPRTIETIPMPNDPSIQINNQYYYINPPPMAPPPPPLPPTGLLPQRSCHNSMFMKKSLYDHYQEMALDMTLSVPPDSDLIKEIPKQYNSVRLLDNPNSTGSTGSFGYISKVFKVVNVNDGMIYCLRRVENVRLSPQIINKSIKLWLQNQHPLIIPLRESFLMNKALFVVHDYYPSAKTIHDRYILSPLALSESFLWSFILQITSVIYTLHMKKIACRCINSHRILETSPMKFHISGIGISDILLYDSKKSNDELIIEDINSFGNLLIQLSCKNIPSIVNDHSIALSNLSMMYSEDLIKFIKCCFDPNMTIFELYSQLQYQSIVELSFSYDCCNNLDIELFRQYNTSRLFHILLHLNLINERPEFRNDKSWCETGKRYLLKLFRDYLFHEMDKDGNAIIDYGFIIDVLYKVDNECNEKIPLSSRDGKSLLIVSYSEIKCAIEECMFELEKNPPMMMNNLYNY